jgi:heme exporter protein A
MAHVMVSTAQIALAGAGLACVRGGREVFSGVDFVLRSGDSLVLTGRNGAGKTTLLRAVAGLLRFEAGRLDLSGGDPQATLAEQVHYVGHQDALKPALTVAENLMFWAAYLGGGANAKATAESLAAVGLAELAAMPAAYLSAGQRRRLSLARLLAAPRPIWLLDEPTTALDARAHDMLAALMGRHLAQGGLILAATHGPLPLDRFAELDLSAAPRSDA